MSSVPLRFDLSLAQDSRARAAEKAVLTVTALVKAARSPAGGRRLLPGQGAPWAALGPLLGQMRSFCERSWRRFTAWLFHGTLSGRRSGAPIAARRRLTDHADEAVDHHRSLQLLRYRTCSCSGTKALRLRGLVLRKGDGLAATLTREPALGELSRTETVQTKEVEISAYHTGTSCNG